MFIPGQIPLLKLLGYFPRLAALSLDYNLIGPLGDPIDHRSGGGGGGGGSTRNESGGGERETIRSGVAAGQSQVAGNELGAFLSSMPQLKLVESEAEGRSSVLPRNSRAMNKHGDSYVLASFAYVFVYIYVSGSIPSPTAVLVKQSVELFARRAVRAVPLTELGAAGGTLGVAHVHVGTVLGCAHAAEEEFTERHLVFAQFMRQQAHVLALPATLPRLVFSFLSPTRSSCARCPLRSTLLLPVTGAPQKL